MPGCTEICRHEVHNKGRLSHDQGHQEGHPSGHVAEIDGYGDVAFKGGAETVSLGWTAVKWVLQAVKADAEQCAQWAEASGMISRILLTCRTIGKMQHNSENTTPTELVQQLLSDIPQVYEAILTYSWSARKQVEKSGIGRMASKANPWSSSASASKTAYDSIRDKYQQIRADEQIAFDEYTRVALKGLDEGQKDVLLSIRQTYDASQKRIDEIVENQKELLEEIKKLAPPTPYGTSHSCTLVALVLTMI